jgi:two-component system OmpR family response regulator
METEEHTDHVLVVDDDAEIRRLLRDYLERHALRISTARDGREMWQALERSHVDLVVLDLMLPGESGLELCRSLRERSQVPVIMLTALGEEADRIVGLEMGADDYVTKPFSPRELLARIRGVLRRTRAFPHEDALPPARRYRFADWVLDTGHRHLINPAGVVVALSGGEFRLLSVLVAHANRTLSRDQLLDLTRGREAGPFDRSVDVLVGRLRRRLGDDGREPRLIKTVRGEGYVLAADVRVEVPSP